MGALHSNGQRSRPKRVSRELIRTVARKIGRLFKPEKVVLFGSYASGAPGRDSDVDLLVVLRTRRDPADMAAEIACAVHPPFPLDVLVKTPDEVRWRLAESDCFMTEILAGGKLLYEARHARVG